MALIVEDGTRPAGANSYVSLVVAREYALARGITLSAVDATLESQIIKAMDWVESHDAQFVGARVDRNQPLSWPRIGAVVDGWSWMDAEIPYQLVAALLEAILEVHAGGDLLNSADNLPIIRARVEGAVEIEYAKPSDVRTTNRRLALLMIRRMLKNGGSQIMAVRV